MHYEISPEVADQAKHPHEWFLINLIFNHILIFVATLSASSLQYLVVVVPIISVIVLTYILMRARRSMLSDPWFVKCHWQVAARRSRLFIGMLGLMALVIIGVLLVSGGDPKPQHYAIGGVGILPTMLSVLVLIIMESDAMHQARTGRLPEWVVKKYPNPEMHPVES